MGPKHGRHRFSDCKCAQNFVIHPLLTSQFLSILGSAKAYPMFQCVWEFHSRTKNGKPCLFYRVFDCNWHLDTPHQLHINYYTLTAHQLRIMNIVNDMVMIVTVMVIMIMIMIMLMITITITIITIIITSWSTSTSSSSSTTTVINHQSSIINHQFINIKSKTEEHKAINHTLIAYVWLHFTTSQHWSTGQKQQKTISKHVRSMDEMQSVWIYVFLSSPILGSLFDFGVGEAFLLIPFSADDSGGMHFFYKTCSNMGWTCRLSVNDLGLVWRHKIISSRSSVHLLKWLRLMNIITNLSCIIISLPTYHVWSFFTFCLSGLWLTYPSEKYETTRQIGLDHHPIGGKWRITELPSGELTFCHGKSPFLMGKSTISMAIFNGKMLVYQRVYPINIPLNHYKSH